MIETKKNEITLKETLIKPFLIVLKLSYDMAMTDEEWFDLKIQEFCESIVTANKYQFQCERQLSQKLVDIFEFKLSESSDQTLDNTTVWEVLEMAKLHNLLILFELCLNFFDEYIDYAFKTFDNQFISADILLDVIRRDTFGAPEIKIFNLVEKWIQKHKIVSNRKCIEEELLLESIRLNLLSFQELESIMKSGLYDTEVIDRIVKHEMSGILAQNKRICYETGKPFRTTDCKNETHLKSEQMIAICVNCNLRMPSKINRLSFTIQSTDPFLKFYANFWIGIADSQAENGFRKILDYTKECCLGEQNIYFDKPFVAESVRILVECLIEPPEPPVDVEDLAAEADPPLLPPLQPLPPLSPQQPLRAMRPIVSRRGTYRRGIGEHQRFGASPPLGPPPELAPLAPGEPFELRNELRAVAGLYSNRDPNWRRRSVIHRRLHASSLLNSRVISIGSIEYEYTKSPLKTINSIIVPEVNVCQKKGVQCYSPYFGDRFTAYLCEEVLNNSLGAVIETPDDPLLFRFALIDDYPYEFWERLPKKVKESFEVRFQNLIQRPICLADETNHYIIRLSQPIFANCLQFELILENEKSRHSDECLAAECKVELCPTFSRDMSSAEWTAVSTDSYLTQSGFCNLEFDLQKVSVIRISGFRYNSDKSLIYALHLKNFSIPADRQSWSWTSGAKLGNETTVESSK